ncbi:hypothetical protein TSMEX_006875 [Taenia solium]|eukprot:TsM_000409900 transcript=TsM_000409900 gene=TsM_000409900
MLPIKRDTKTSLPPLHLSACDVSVPPTYLFNGSLIYGGKVPKQRHPKTWLEANPDCIPCFVESVNRDFVDRAVKARGQNTPQ